MTTIMKMQRIIMGVLLGLLIVVAGTGCSDREVLAPAPAAIAPVKSAEPSAYDVELFFPSNDYPETALHIYGAIEQGASAVCTIDREGAADNRKASLAGVDTKNGYDRDEWPMAMCEEGGAGASVAYIDSSDNRGAGSWVGNRLTDYPDGTRVLFVVVKPELKFGKYTEEKEKASGQTMTPGPEASEESKVAVAPDDTFYQNCSAVRAAGKAPLHEGDPGYSRKLDRDGDGVACE